MTIGIITADFCRECDLQANLFDNEDRRLDEGDQSDQTMTCLCPSDATIHVGPTREEFLEEFKDAVQDFNVIDNLVSIDEKDPLFCEEELTSFRKLVTVEFQAICELLDDDTPLLETAMVDVYNAMSAANYCDPHFRSLATAKVVTMGDRTDDSTISIQFLVQGTCRGCEPEDVSIFDLTSSEGRLLGQNLKLVDRSRQTLGTCYCSAQATANRAPSEVEFIEAYERNVEESSDFLCVTSISACDAT